MLELDRIPIRGVPKLVRVAVGERYALVVPDPDDARFLADLVVGLSKCPADTTVRADGGIRLVPAEGGLLPHLTVFGNLVRCSYSGRRIPRRTAEEKCLATAIRCGLGDVLDRFPHQITPGRRRLAGVARALRAQPVAIVLEDAVGLPTWGALLNMNHNPELLSAALLLITPTRDEKRTSGFKVPSA
jgi:hypothetical protein